MIDPEDAYCWADDCLVSMQGPALYLLPQSTESPLLLVDTAYVIAKLLGVGNSIQVVVDSLSQRYGISKQDALSAVVPFVSDLVERNVLTPTESGAPVESSGPMKILTVCTGNICRSVYTQHLLQAVMQGRGANVEVASAGVRVNPRLSVPDEIERALEDEGLTAAGHAPRQLTADMINQADLVLTATVEQRREVLKMAPLAMRKVFTLLEAAAVANALEVEQQETVGARSNDPRALAMARSTVPAGTPLDLVDPYRRSQQDYDTMVRTAYAAVTKIGGYLTTT